MHTCKSITLLLLKLAILPNLTFSSSVTTSSSTTTSTGTATTTRLPSSSTSQTLIHVTRDQITHELSFYEASIEKRYQYHGRRNIATTPTTVTSKNSSCQKIQHVVTRLCRHTFPNDDESKTTNDDDDDTATHNSVPSPLRIISHDDGNDIIARLLCQRQSTTNETIPKDSKNTPPSLKNIDSFRDWCVRHIATIPQPIDNNGERSDDLSSSSTGKTNEKEYVIGHYHLIIPYPTPQNYYQPTMTTTMDKRYLSQTFIFRNDDDDDNPRESTTCYLSSPFHPNCGIVDHNQPPSKQSSTDDPIVTANVLTKVDGNGAHRISHHEVRLTLHHPPPPATNPTTELSKIKSASLTLLYPSGYHIYVDSDDPSPTGTHIGCVSSLVTTMTGCRVELLHAPGEEADVEQTSFGGGGGNVMMFRLWLDFENEWDDRVGVPDDGKERRRCHVTTNDDGQKNEDMFCVWFDLSFHIRYLEPTIGDCSNGGIMGVLSSSVVNLTLWDMVPIDGWLKDDRGKKITFDLNVGRVLEGTKFGPVVISAMTGCDDHYEFVMLLTGIFGFVGSLLLIRSVWNVGRWNYSSNERRG